jgi:hypothetical protein
MSLSSLFRKLFCFCVLKICLKLVSYAQGLVFTPSSCLHCRLTVKHLWGKGFAQQNKLRIHYWVALHLQLLRQKLHQEARAGAQRRKILLVRVFRQGAPLRIHLRMQQRVRCQRIVGCALEDVLRNTDRLRRRSFSFFLLRIELSIKFGLICRVLLKVNARLAPRFDSAET